VGVMDDLTSGLHRMVDGNPPPKPPEGYEALRTGADGSCSLFGPHHPTQITHLIRGGKPSDGTLCGLSLFDGPDRKSDVGGWSRGGGVSGPNITQIQCVVCWAESDG
jgi:hypothetical protein